ncbi:MAG TPA: siphovirus ReqiPepy6 Gp37-like family protein [Candidatus Limiplasma sp.]|nr:siphovirus ReqiPepy6 Gp37-like family protein [Candidatus Limiplasma sp.]
MKNTALQVMNLAFEKLGEIAQYTSLTITRSYYGTGSIEITIDPRAQNAMILLPPCIVWPSGEPEKACIIEDIATITRTKLQLKGSTLKGMAKNKICVPPLSGTRPYQDFGWDRYTGPAESAYHHFAHNNMIAPEDANRAVPDMIAATDQGRGTSLPWQARFDRLDTIFQSIGEATEVGWNITLDLTAKKFVFGAWVGVDRTSGSALALISEKNGNASDSQYKKTVSGSATTVYVGGSGEDENRFILNVGGSNTGHNRRELWADAGSVDDADMIRLFGQTKLDASGVKESLTLDLIDSGMCRYGRDYDVGDKVIARGTYNSMSARIIEITETHENGARTIKGTFGDAPITTAAIQRRASGAAR